jgi:transposase
MMGHRQVEQAALFYEFSLERHIPPDHLLRSIDRFVELSDLRRDLAGFYSSIGRPSIDPELMIRMLIIGYCFGIRSERPLCEEVHLNLAYRWFCRLGLDGEVPDHSTFCKNRYGRFRASDLLLRLFETVLRRCIREGLVGGEGFAVDASLIKADASRQNGVEGEKALPPEATGRAVEEYLAVLDDAAFGAATEVTPKFISPVDPAARWTGAHGGQAFFAYSTNYLIDIDNAIIVDVEATTAIRQAEVLAAKRMIERSMERFDLYPAKLIGDSAYGSAAMLGWLFDEHGIAPHVSVFDKSARNDGTFSREEFTYDHQCDIYSCPGGKPLTTTGTLVNDGATILYRASKHDCAECALKSKCCPNSPTRRVPRSIHEGARDMARQIAKSWEGRTSRRLRKKVEMLFAHLKRILRLDRYDCEGRTVRVTSSSSQQPPRTSESWRN